MQQARKLRTNDCDAPNKRQAISNLPQESRPENQIKDGWTEIKQLPEHSRMEKSGEHDRYGQGHPAKTINEKPRKAQGFKELDIQWPKQERSRWRSEI